MHGDLDHSVDEVINQVLSVTPVTTSWLMETMSLVDETALRGGGLERPEESVDLLEVGTNGEDLVDDVLGSVNSELSELFGDGSVVSEGNSATVDLQETSLVNQLSDSGEGWVSERAVGSNSSEHLGHWSVHLEENAVVQLSQSEQLQDFLRLGGHLVDTDESGHVKELGLGLNEEVSVLASLSAHSHQVRLSGVIFLQVSQGSLLELRSLDGVLLRNDNGTTEELKHTLTFFSMASVFILRSDS